MDTIKKREKIKNIFIHEAMAHGKAIEIGDYKSANKIHKKINSLYKEAKDLNQADLFSELLNEPDENVRLWAAIFTLKVFPDLGKNSLTNLSELHNIVGLSAKTTLSLWEEGKLDLL